MSRRALAVMVIALAAIVVLAVPFPARAEHTPEHRYFLVGAVTNEEGQALCGVVVRATVPGAPDGTDRNRTASTDLSGRYSIQLHLHSGREPEANPPDIGIAIRISIDAYGLYRVTNATINTNNPQGWGQQTFDFEVPGARSPSLCLMEVVAISGGGVAALIALTVLVRRRRSGPRRTGGRAHRALLEVPGMNRSRVRDLEAAGIGGVKDLADADPEELSKSTNLTPKEARLLIKRAHDMLQGKKG